LAIIITLHFLLGLSTFSYDGSRWCQFQIWSFTWL
jgi:hypothetical protein